jgi:hypothetical protein
VDFETHVEKTGGFLFGHGLDDQQMVSQGSNGPGYQYGGGAHEEDLSHGDELNHMRPDNVLHCQNLVLSNVDFQVAFEY